MAINAQLPKWAAAGSIPRGCMLGMRCWNGPKPHRNRVARCCGIAP